MGGGPSTPPAPAPTPLMPLLDQEAINRATRKSTAMTQERSGRVSTALSQTGDKLG